MKPRTALALVFCANVALAAAAQPVPDAGLRAEARGQWAEAVEIYQQALKADPAQAQLWERIADIHAVRLKQPERAAAALQEAVKHAPKDARLYHKLSQAHAAAGEAPAALTAVNRAVELEPDNATYLRARGEIAALTGDYALARDSLERVLARAPEDAVARKQQARILAWTGRPRAALAVIAELEPAMRDDYELAHARTVALAAAHRPRAALAGLAEVTRLRPDSKETADLTRVIRTPLRSNVTFGSGYVTGSDDITIRHAGVRAEYAVNPETRLFGGGERRRIGARAGSGYEKPDGGAAIGYDRAWLGIRHRAAPELALDARAGTGTAEGDDRSIYEVGADYQPLDDLAVRLARRQDLHAVSPRAAKLGIERRADTLDATWTPDPRWTLAGRFGSDAFSDGNHRREVVLAPRRAILRTQQLNHDLGVSGQWFGYDRDPGNGYYAPTRYERYALTAFTYRKISDDDGVSIALGVGPYKDNTMSGFRTGGDIVAEGFFGIYRDWFLNVKAALSDFGGGAADGYHSRLIEINLTRRF